jgi:hypothetical protein
MNLLPFSGWGWVASTVQGQAPLLRTWFPNQVFLLINERSVFAVRLGSEGDTIECVKLSMVSLSIAIMIIAPAMASVLIGLAALRGTRPEDRPEILRALAVYAAALILRIRPVGERPIRESVDKSSPPE